jgi:hypothetical protein
MNERAGLLHTAIPADVNQLERLNSISNRLEFHVSFVIKTQQAIHPVPLFGAG